MLSKQCLDRRIGDIETMGEEVGVWVKERNTDRVKINWQFSKDAAREKFQERYIDIINL